MSMKTFGYRSKSSATLLIASICASFVAPLFVFPPRAHAADTVIFLTSGTSWTVPSDWNSSNNTIEVIGGGGGGVAPASAGGGGGGGGAYSKAVNVSLTPSSSVTYAVGTGGGASTAGGDTYICNVQDSGGSCDAIGDAATQAGAKGGSGGSASSGGSGGASASGVGSTKNSGGNGGNGTGSASGGGAGGGGAAGPNGIGANGGTSTGAGGSGGGGANGGSVGSSSSSGPGADGGNGRGGSGGGTGGPDGFGNEQGGAGSNGGGGGGGFGGDFRNENIGDGGAGGTEVIWTSTLSATAGPSGGGGGAGGNLSTSFPDSNIGGAGGISGGYGGGGGGGGDNDGTAGSGRQGIIVITYTAVVSTLPDAPTNLITTSITGGVSLSWTAPASSGSSNLETYGVWRATSPFTATTSAALLISIATTSTSYSDTSAVRGTIYFYRVTATNGTATSSLSNQKSSSSNSGRVIRLGGLLRAS